MADRPQDAPTPASDEPAAHTPKSRKGLTIALGILALGVAAAVFGVLSRENEPNPVDEVASALATDATVLAGPMSVTKLEHTKCVKQSDTVFRCTPVMDNATAGSGVVVVYKNRIPTKRLAGSNLTEAPRRGDDVAAALDADEHATLGRTVKYGCAFSGGLNPDGSQAPSSPGGFRCATLKAPAGSTAPLQRYVEFAADGSVTRDFMLAGG